MKEKVTKVRRNADRLMLVDYIYRKTNFKKDDILLVIEVLFEAMIDQFLKGRDIEIRDFGCWRFPPPTKKKLLNPEHITLRRRTIIFKESKLLKKLLVDKFQKDIEEQIKKKEEDAAKNINDNVSSTPTNVSQENIGNG